MESNLQKLNITLEYNSKSIILKVEPYKKISYLKQQAQNYFYPLEGEIKLVSNKKDLTKYENNLIGDIFRGKDNIPISIEILSKNTSKQSKQKYNNLNILNSYDFQESTPSSNKYQKQKNSKTLPKSYVCSCKCGTIKYLCRNCNIFLCLSCRQNKTHLQHSIINIDFSNLKESAKLYAITVQKEINDKKKNLISTYEKNKQMNFSLTNERYNQFMDKLMKIQQMYEEMINVINITNEKMNKMEELMKHYNQNCNEVKEGLDCIIGELCISKSNKGSFMDFEKFKDVCKRIKDKEEKIIECSCDMLAYGVNCEVNEKIDLLYDKLDKIVDDTIQKEIPLNLKMDTYVLYEDIKKWRIKEKEENKEDELKEEEGDIEEENKEYERGEEEKKEDEEEKKEGEDIIEHGEQLTENEDDKIEGSQYSMNEI